MSEFTTICQEPLSKNTISNFVRVDENGCWLWTKTLLKTGYGSYHGQPAYRAVYEVFNGKIPENSDGSHHGICVLHKCDVRACVNPDHLFLGTQRENLADMVNKGRGVGPLKQAKKVLTLTEVQQVKELRAAGMTYKELSSKFGLSTGSLHEIVHGRNKSTKKKGERREYRSLTNGSSSNIDTLSPNKTYFENPSVEQPTKMVSKFFGVSRHANGAWVVRYKGVYIGVFKQEIEAALAYDEAAISHKGHLAKTNASAGLYFGPDRDPTENDWRKEPQSQK